MFGARRMQQTIRDINYVPHCLPAESPQIIIIEWRKIILIGAIGQLQRICVRGDEVDEMETHAGAAAPFFVLTRPACAPRQIYFRGVTSCSGSIINIGAAEARFFKVTKPTCMKVVSSKWCNERKIQCAALTHKTGSL